jgi:hypothetical protein
VLGATFKGKVVDAETKEPIEGAVVVAVWHEETATIAGPSSRFKDVKETLTDKNGKWAMKGPRGIDAGFIATIFSFLTGAHFTEPPKFIIFKPGYCSWPQGFSIEACKSKIEPGGNRDIIEGKTIELPKLTNKEDRRRAALIWPSAAGGDLATAKKLENFVKLLDKEEKTLGFGGHGWVRELETKVSDYLILSDIGSYGQSSKSEFMGIEFPNENKNLREVDITTERLSDEQYFSYKTYKTRYVCRHGKPSLIVEVKEFHHTHWLLHNIQYDYRAHGPERLGLLIPGAQLRLIDGNKIISSKGNRYSWISKNVVVGISSADLDDDKPEPLEVIRAYLGKFPSTIPDSLAFNLYYDEKWIKDEMEKRLLISSYLFHMIDTVMWSKEKKVLSQIVDNANIFLDYRAKYYNEQSKDEKQLLQQYLNVSNRKEIENKVRAFNQWWREYKGRRIYLP